MLHTYWVEIIQVQNDGVVHFVAVCDSIYEVLSFMKLHVCGISTLESVVDSFQVDLVKMRT